MVKIKGDALRKHPDVLQLFLKRTLIKSRVPISKEGFRKMRRSRVSGRLLKDLVASRSLIMISSQPWLQMLASLLSRKIASLLKDYKRSKTPTTTCKINMLKMLPDFHSVRRRRLLKV